MRYFTLSLLLLFAYCNLFAQQGDPWYAFYNQDSTLIGFKDGLGRVKIKPKFEGVTTANRFDDILAATEKNNGQWNSFYLTKSGRKIGHDSLHIIDNGADCESEGFIRFRDPQTYLTGLFNRNGDIAIPAMYSGLTRVHNGLMVALKGATKKRVGIDSLITWVGGQEVLLDTSNQVLIADFQYQPTLNFFSLQKTKELLDDPARISFVGTDGLHYSFINFQKEFENWLKTDLLVDLTKSKLLMATYPQVTWEAVDAWKKSDKTMFIERNFDLIKTKLIEITNSDTDYFISADGLNPFMFDAPEFHKYYNNCGESKDWLYPTMSIIITHKNKKDLVQDHLEFLRTDEGYQLLCVTIRKGQLK